jgi:DNA mismatch repair protein MutL
MSKIALLDPQLVNQIAAGEVVERPSSVVKELVENSIDSGATKIVVEVKTGGIDKIKITDNGCGMSVEDAFLSLERHATSKIRTLDDLLRVNSMGFRGEALASIASVSRLALRTQQASDSSGIELVTEGGKLLRQSPIGIPTGTEIEILDLFFNTPVRLKFLKSEQTEYQNVLDAVIQAALANPQISIKLIQEKEEGEARTPLDLPATDDQLVRIRGVLGQNIAEDLIEVFYGGVNLSIRGYIGKPQLSRANRSMQYFFVNGRPINSHVLSYAVKQAYHSLLPKERYPAFVIFFELDPTMVDVNCHPRKTEVKFRDEREVYKVVLQSCKAALETAVLSPKITQGSANYYQEKSSTGLDQSTRAVPTPVAPEFQSAQTRETVNVSVSDDVYQLNLSQSPASVSSNVESFSENAGIPTDVSPATKFTEQTMPDNELIALGQLDNSFILCQRGSDLVIIDQHAAHERIRYNALMSEAEHEDKVVQPALVPITVDLPPADLAVLEGNKEVLDEIGFTLQPFGGSTFAINEVPAYLVKSDLRKVLIGLIDDLRNVSGDMKGHKGDLFSRKEKILTYLACRSAVKFGDPLSREEIDALITQLNETSLGQGTCPHGRPTMIVMEASELWSRFGRKYTGFHEKEKFRDVNC